VALVPPCPKPFRCGFPSRFFLKTKFLLYIILTNDITYIIIHTQLRITWTVLDFNIDKFKVCVEHGQCKAFGAWSWTFLTASLVVESITDLMTIFFTYLPQLVPIFHQLALVHRYLDPFQHFQWNQHNQFQFHYRRHDN